MSGGDDGGKILRGRRVLSLHPILILSFPIEPSPVSHLPL